MPRPSERKPKRIEKPVIEKMTLEEQATATHGGITGKIISLGQEKDMIQQAIRFGNHTIIQTASGKIAKLEGNQISPVPQEVRERLKPMLEIIAKTRKLTFFEN